MKSNNLWGRVVVVAASLLLLAGGTAFAQLQTGNLYAKVLDQQGTALPGVTVTLDTGANQEVQVSNAQGEVRFLSLPPANMKLKAELQGFSTVEYPNVSISVGHNTTVEITMNSAVEDVITVTAESPLLDERKISTGSTISATELAKIPTSRDPWTILSSTPGVQIDRVNVGGNESGQQSQYIGPGSTGANSVWSVDGVVITDMAALGSSPSYYDFDAFQEMQVTTGGTDSTLATGGVVLNLVTKRGTNEWRGSGRYLISPSAAQSTSSFSNSNLAPGEPPYTVLNQINHVWDYGAEAGGPIVKDRLWIWGSYGDQNVNVTTAGGGNNKFDLPTYNAKLNAQLTSSNSLTLFGLQNNKKAKGRNSGPSRPQETTWDQGHQGSNPTAAKAEDTQIFGPNFYLTALASDVNGGFGLVPEGGIGPTVYLDQNGVFHNSFIDYITTRPQRQGKLDASSFFNLGSVSNELKYGAGYRTVKTTTLSTWAGAGLIVNGALTPFIPAGDNFFQAVREGNLNITTTYTSGYAQDTLTVGNLTGNVGLRYDLQRGHNNASNEVGSAQFPTLLPAFNYAGGPAGFSWSNVTPRVGLTYALGKERKTLLRASYSRFADQLGEGTVALGNPTAGYSFYYSAIPGNQVGPGAPTGPFGPNFSYSGNVNPLTGLPLLANEINPNLSAPITDEVLGSIEHALLPELVLSLNLTYRRLSNLEQSDLLVFDNPSNNPFDPSTLGSLGRQATFADYVPQTFSGTLPDGKPYTVTYYSLKPGITTRNGTITHNSNRTQSYKGASVVLNKRLANRWMMRGNITYSDWTWTNTSGLPDPTEGVSTTGGFAGGSRNGDPVVINSAGSGAKTYVFINSKWSGTLNALYQVVPDRPWGFNVAGNLTARQGYIIPFFVTTPLNGINGSPINNYAGAVSDNVLIGKLGSSRLPNVEDFDARIEKEFSFQDFGLTLGVDCFNVFNSSTVLQRKASLGTLGSSTTGDYVFEVLSPRIFRFGARINFR